MELKKFKLAVAGQVGHETTLSAADLGAAAIKALNYLGFEVEEIPAPKANQLELALEALGNEVMEAVNAPPA